jgi:hypothetical protein
VFIISISSVFLCGRVFEQRHEKKRRRDGNIAMQHCIPAPLPSAKARSFQKQNPPSFARS